MSGNGHRPSLASDQRGIRAWPGVRNGGGLAQRPVGEQALDLGRSLGKLAAVLIGNVLKTASITVTAVLVLRWLGVIP